MPQNETGTALATPVNTVILPIRAENLTKRFGRLVAVDRVSLHLGPGERLALFGRNGAGKTTCLRILAGLARPDGGRVACGPYTLPRHRSEIHGRMGFLSHYSLLYPDLTVWENLVFAARLFSLHEAPARIEQALSRVGMLERRRERVRHLSSGMERRVALARALLHRPDLLILDEPFSGLDSASVAHLQDLLADHRRSGGSVILTTHHRDEGLRDATRIVIFDRGRVAYAAARDGDAFPGFAPAYARFVEGKP